jgi:hypothetical protein
MADEGATFFGLWYAKRKENPAGIPAAHNAPFVSIERLSVRRSAFEKNGLQFQSQTHCKIADLCTQGNAVSRHKIMFVLLFKDLDLAKLGIGNVNGTVLRPRDTIAAMQTSDRDLAPLLDVTVSNRGP